VKIILPLLAAGLAFAGCATTAPARLGAELPGRTLRIDLPNGEVTRLRFNADGSVVGTGAGGQATGTWQAANAQICMDWPRLGRECFRYAEPFRPGRTVTLTGTSGATVRVTME
jgi:hypothetical protein